MISALLGSILRHLLTSAGGAIIAQGVVTSDQLTQAVGAATTLFGVALSAFQKYKAAGKVQSANSIGFNK